MLKKFICVLLCLLICFSIAGCGDGVDNKVENAEQIQAELIGVWSGSSSSGTHTLTFKADGTYQRDYFIYGLGYSQDTYRASGSYTIGKGYIDFGSGKSVVTYLYNSDNGNLKVFYDGVELNKK